MDIYLKSTSPPDCEHPTKEHFYGRLSVLSTNIIKSRMTFADRESKCWKTILDLLHNIEDIGCQTTDIDITEFEIRKGCSFRELEDQICLDI